MQNNDTQLNPYSHHYRMLELDDRADWETARNHYRRLVNQWHPDRFAQRPRERVHAQQQFIILTKSYNALRNFYRKNNRLPFQSASVATAHEETAVGQNEAQAPDSQNSEPQWGSNPLARERSQHFAQSKTAKSFRKLIWFVVGGTIILCTVLFFLILDRKQNKAIAEEGRKVIQEAPVSEFMPSAVEIRRSQTRGAFVKPTQ